ncbi:hypothetical protein [Deinococcus aquiradiocola]|uniref:Uncharacterized protein n=1 Tax=Deinococcus aquiradiocola TaxID=393059 RepID=A0A917PCZ1_9DEIO|nr:hypothetical protein [Deinococcus aquiradiocola]GGJ71354.1 hypothetical protein GCM10008939_14660 [Deinococcus aquiradiocola]
MSSDFDALQRALKTTLSARQAEARACEALLNALYHAFRNANGPGLPVNNVSLEHTEDPDNRLRPPPLGGWHAAWYRLGLLELYIRVRRGDGTFTGQYGPHGTFTLHDIAEDALTALARHILRDLTAEQEGKPLTRTDIN